MEDFRYLIAKDYYDLVNEWNSNNMLYNSLRFYQIYSGHVEKSNYAVMFYSETNQLAEKNQSDIMTSWWTPIKWFIFRKKEGSRELLTQYLIENIPKENNLEELTIALSLLRHQDENILSKDLVNEMLEFLSVVYSAGNLTANSKTKVKGPLDGWDYKLEEMKCKMSNMQWKNYIKYNYFQMFFVDEQYQEIKRFWEYGARNLKDATDADWMQYFRNATKIINERNQLLKKKS